MALVSTHPGHEAPLRLTEMSPAGGCAAKMCPLDLAQMLESSGVRSTDAPGVLVGSRESDDAAVVEMRAALMAYTVDFMPPVVDDPEIWGKVVVANVFSDLYAEGARPELALAILQWPARLGLDGAGRLVGAARRRVSECGAILLGGHTIQGETPLFGLAAIGTIDGEPTRNSTARPGDFLLLTKAIGTGVAVTAIKAGRCPEPLEIAATESMCALNDDAADAARTFGASAVTDVSGFGLLGHAREMAVASSVTLELDLRAVPVLPEVGKMIAAGVVTSGGARNRRDLMPDVSSTLGWVEEVLVSDPQTSGGLLMAVPAVAAEQIIAALGGVTAVIGRVHPAGAHPIVLVGA